MVLGSQTARSLQNLKKEARQDVFARIRRFFVTASDYIMLKFPLKSEILKSAEVARLSTFEQARFADVKYFIGRFPVLLTVAEEQSMESALDEGQAQFSRLRLKDLPAQITVQKRIDEQWGAVSDLQDMDGTFKYAKLSKVILGILTVSHSNAKCERVFSKVKKAHMQFRSSMSKKTLKQLFVVRCSQSGKCHQQMFDKDFLRKAKAATSSMLAQPPTSKE
ncbi:unnamed protein product [Ixodes pacificus]